jgi:hypothetical protein
VLSAFERKSTAVLKDNEISYAEIWTDGGDITLYTKRYINELNENGKKAVSDALRNKNYTAAQFEDVYNEFEEKMYLGLVLSLMRRINEGFDMWERGFVRFEEDVAFRWDELWELRSLGNLGMSLKNERSVVFVSFKSELEFMYCCCCCVYSKCEKLINIIYLK